MRTDAVVLGAELDALVAALRLLEMGHSVRVLAAGAGSLHFAPGGVHRLRSPPDDGHRPLDRLRALDARHPYRIVGGEQVRAALDWFFDTRFESLVIDNEREEAAGLDAVVCSGGRIELEPIIEDELLLALPNAPVHPRGSCEAPPIRAAREQPQSRRSNPFSALRALRANHGRDRSS